MPHGLALTVYSPTFPLAAPAGLWRNMARYQSDAESSVTAMDEDGPTTETRGVVPSGQNIVAGGVGETGELVYGTPFKV